MAERPAQERRPRRARAGLVLGLLAIALGARAMLAEPASVLELSGRTMGTTWSARIGTRGHPDTALAAARPVIEEALARVDGQMSTWREDSELSRLNRHASTEPFSLSPETFEVLALAAEVSSATGGAFDVTVRPLVAVWGFGAGARLPGDPPDAATLARLRERVGHRLLALDAATRTVQKRRLDVECDLSAIAKGYGVDLAADALVSLGLSDFLLEVGGELAARGVRPDGQPWRAGIERPDAEPRTVEAAVPLRDQAMATSGDYRDFYERDGRRLAHIIDPRTGQPVVHAPASVTVVHPRAAVADAWATALSVLGPDEGLELAERLELAAYFLVRTDSGGFEPRMTRAFAALDAAAVR